MVVTATSGSMTLSAAGARTWNSGCTQGPTTPSVAVAAGTFKVKGAKGDSWTVSVDTTQSVTLSDGSGHNMTFSSVSFSPATGTFPSSGSSPTTSGPISLGLTVAFSGGAPPAGTYTGQVSVRVKDNTNGLSSPSPPTAGTTVPVSIQVITPPTLTKTADLVFGGVIALGAGTVTVPTTGSLTHSANIVLPASNGGHPASFTVGGNPGTSYSITLPGSLSISDGATPTAHTMTVNTFTRSPSGTGTLSAQGTQTLTVGAQLNVNAGQAPGTYTGSLAVTVTYN